MSRKRSYTVKFKLSAIEWHNAKGTNVTKTAQEFGVDRKRIRDWLSSEDTLRINARDRRF